MKKQRRVSIITVIGCLLILLISACVDAPNRDSDDNTDNDDNDYPIFEYTLLEKVLAEVLGKVPGEEITPAELATLIHLKIPFSDRLHAHSPYIGFDSGGIALLAHCVNLKELDLSGNKIADLSPLAGLTHLEWLNLSSNRISDLKPLAGLVNLQVLNLSRNRLNDLTALAGMIQLKELYLQHNQIHDITSLAHLIQIEKFYLHNNMIVDLKPLVDNPGLVNNNPVHLEGGFEWRADVVTVRDNPLSAVSRNVYIPALEARGVIVRH